MGQFILNGRNYSGITYANGCFVDTTNIITSGTITAGVEGTYLASEDVAFDFLLYASGGQNAYLKIDGTNIFSSNSGINRNFVFLKKGQTATFGSYGTNGNYTVYGIQEGSPVTFLSEYASACYDTTEREVGCWIDGKPLYQKCINFGNLPNNGERSVAHGIANVDNIFIAGGFVTTGTAFYNLEHATDSSYDWSSRVDGTNATITTYTDRSNLTAIIVVQYTKTTDVAGSGKLTPTAMPTVHYDDTERIIGTWFGETLYQKTVVYNNPTLGRVDDLPHNIANIDTITNVEWVALESSGSAIVGHENNDSNWWADFFVVNRTGVSYRIGGSWGVTKIVVTIQYTKTT